MSPVRLSLSLVLCLPSAATCAAFCVQADAGDEYVLEVSTDRTAWRAAGTVARSSAGPGLRTRDIVFPAPVELRYANYLLPALLVRGARCQVPLAAALAGTCGFLFIDDYEVYNAHLSAVILVWLLWTVAGRRC